MPKAINSSKNYSLPKECEISILRFLSKSKVLTSKTKSEIEVFGKSIFENVIKFFGHNQKRQNNSPKRQHFSSRNAG